MHVQTFKFRSLVAAHRQHVVADTLVAAQTWEVELLPVTPPASAALVMLVVGSHPAHLKIFMWHGILIHAALNAFCMPR